ncbi:MAG: MFS transporter [Bacteroidia bacterium]|jgi:MFS family permease|nr:MFS transporter [Bacteroidia bacterium]MBP7245496.1 MFS transporter [Bacteroidia bacterium]
MFKSKFSKNVWLLGCISLFADISSELLYPVLPLFLKEAGYSMLVLGMLEGIANVVAGVSKGYFGHRSDQLQQRAVFVKWGYGLSALGKMMMMGSPDLMRIFSGRITDRLGKGIRTAPRDSLLALESSPETRAAVFGFHRGLDTLGAAIGPSLALLWLWWMPGDYSTLFTIAFIPAVISLILAFRLKEKKVNAEVNSKTHVGFFSYFNYWKTSHVSFRKFLFPLMLFALVNSPDVFLLMALNEAGFSDTAMIAVYILYNLLYALLAMPIGVWADKWGKINVMLIGVFLFALCYFGMAWMNSLLAFTILFAVYAFSISCLESVAKAVISNIVPTQERGQAIGFYTSVNSLGVLFAGVWTGWLWSIGGPQLVFSITAGVALISFFILRWNASKINIHSV